jgi:hypothetical protein
VITTSAVMRSGRTTIVCSAPCPTSPSRCASATLLKIVVVLEVIISGHHLGAWRGLPPTGRPVRFPLCGIFTFDSENRLAGEKTITLNDGPAAHYEVMASRMKGLSLVLLPAPLDR